MRRARRLAATLAIAILVAPAVAAAERAKLGGSPASMRRQHDAAVAQELRFLRTPAQVRALAARGQLERVSSGSDFALSKVSYPFARPEVRVFIERLAAQYHAEVGEKLVVTSLTRPAALQPRNAHALSVHPAGMAVDFRVPANAAGRRWLEKTLLSLERTGVLDVTRERMPPHYHVAVFPAAYRAYVDRVNGPGAFAAAAAPPAPAPAPVAGDGHAPTSELPRASASPIVAGEGTPAALGLLAGTLAATLVALLLRARPALIR